MNAKFKNSNGWILCPSKSFPGKFYYFNVVTGETVWSSDAETKPFRRAGTFANIHKVTESHMYPEPSSPPIEFDSPSNSFSNNNHSSNHFTAAKQTSPTFGQVTFPKYIPHMQFMPNIIWTPVPVPTAPRMPVPLHPVYSQNFEKRRKVFDQGTQTCENIFMPSTSSPVLKSSNINFNSTAQNGLAFSNFDNSKHTFTNSATTANNVFSSKQNFSVNSEARRNWFAGLQPAKPICKKPTKRSWLLSEPTLTNSESTDNTNEIVNITHYENTKGLLKRVHSNPKLYESADFNETENERLPDISKLEQLKLTDISKVEQPKPTDQIKVKKLEEALVKRQKLQENDLRLLLLAKKRKEENLGAISEKPNKYQKLSQEAFQKDSMSRKKVSFYLDSISDEEYFSSEVPPDNGPVKLDIKYLWSLAEPSMKTDRWYIIPDSDVLMNDFELIKQFVQCDARCRVYIARALYVRARAQSIGECRSRPRAIAARTLVRALADSGHLVVVQEPDENNTPISLHDNILSCSVSLLQQKYHTVIITKDETLKNKAQSLNLHSHLMDEIQHNDGDSHPIFDMKRINKLFNDTNDQPLPSTSNKTAYSQNRNSIFEKTTLPTINSIKPLKTHENLFSTLINENKTQNSNFLFNYKIPRTKNEREKSEIVPSHSTAVNPVKEKNYVRENFYQKHVASDKNDMRHLKKEKSLFANSNLEPTSGQFEDDRKELIAEGYYIEDNLKRFRVKNRMIEERVKNRLNEWDCTLTQVMEDALSEVLQNNGRQINKRLPPPWTLHQATEYITQYYNQDHLVRKIAWKLSTLLTNVKHSNGKLQESVSPNDFMEVLGCCIMLIQALQIIHPSIRTLSTAEDLLLHLLKLIEDPSLDLDPAQNNNPSSVGYKSEEGKDVERADKNSIKKSVEVLQYLAKHYPEWDSYKAQLGLNNLDQIYENKASQRQSVKVIRTVGKDLNLLKINNNNKITMSDKPVIKNDTDSNDSNTSIIQNKLVHAEINQTQPKSDKNKSSNNKDEVTNSLNVTTHENTFGTAKETNGPKVVRNVNVIEAFEKKLRPDLDMDVLDYSDFVTKDSYDDDSEDANLNDNGENDNHNDKYNKDDNYNDKLHDNDADDEDVDGNSNADSGNFNLDHDSGIGNEPGITTIQEFLNVLYQFLKIVYDFIYATLSKLRKEMVGQEKHVLNKWNVIYLLIDPVIERLKSIIARESGDNSSGYSHLVKSGIDTTRYMQIVSESLKCVESMKQIMLDVNIQDSHKQ